MKEVKKASFIISILLLGMIMRENWERDESTFIFATVILILVVILYFLDDE